MASLANNLPAFIANRLDDIATSEGFIDYAIKHEAGTKPGDGFMAEMLAVSLEGHRLNSGGLKELHRLNLICKLQPRDEVRREQYKCSWVFEREVLMYNRVLPLFAKMQRDQGLNETNGFFGYPKCYYASYEPENPSESIIIMEDLRASGFTRWDKKKISPLENIKLLLEQLGRMHALSFVLRDQNPDVLKELAAELPEIFGPLLRVSGFVPIFQSGFTRAAKLMEQESHSDIFERMKDRWAEMYDACFDVSRYERFAVVSHGDLWINNMMFLLEDGIGKQISILDWQAGHMRSPASDISNFLFTVTDSDTRATHMAEYLDTYYSNLSAMIRAFGSDPNKLFSRTDFDEQLKQNGFYGILNGPLSFPGLVSDPSAVSDMSSLAKSTNSGKTDDVHLFVLDEQREIKYKELFCDVFKDADRYGWIEVMKTL